MNWIPRKTAVRGKCKGERHGYILGGAAGRLAIFYTVLDGLRTLRVWEIERADSFTFASSRIPLSENI